MTPSLELALSQVASWDADHVAVAVVGPDGVRGIHGDASHRYQLASVTKLVTAWTVLAAAETGLLELGDDAGPPGSTVRHLLAHASGLPFDGEGVQAEPGRRRIYSNSGFDRLGTLVADRAGEPFDDVVQRTISEPLGMRSAILVDRPSQGLEGSLDDLIRFAGELLRPTLVSAATAALATTVAFPGLRGVVPGVGNFDPCDWGLGFEIHGTKAPHWMGSRNSPAAFGHFGGSGTFLWVDPSIDAALVAVTDRAFGPWALDAWPALSDAVVASVSG